MSFDDYNPLKKTPVRIARSEDVPEDFCAPARESNGAGAYDLRAFIPNGEKAYVYPRCSKVFRTGFRWSIPEGMLGIANIRSSLGFKHNIRLANALGFIDHDFRGEVLLALYNDSQEPYVIEHGERIGQMAIVSCHMAGLEEVPLDRMDQTVRGDGGFGHTGKM